jgi:hypothetical protein
VGAYVMTATSDELAGQLQRRFPVSAMATTSITKSFPEGI